MVDAHLVQNRGMKIVNVDWILGDVVAEFVRFADGKPGLMPPPAIHM